MKPTGIKLQHATLRNALFIVENRRRPYGDGGFRCNLCLVHHRWKTTHLWLEPDGSCLVSVGVLEELRAAGFPKVLRVTGSTSSPPPLRIGKVGTKPVTHREFRPAVDNQNRRVWLPAGFRHVGRAHAN